MKSAITCLQNIVRILSLRLRTVAALAFLTKGVQGYQEFCDGGCLYGSVLLLQIF